MLYQTIPLQVFLFLLLLLWYQSSGTELLAQCGTPPPAEPDASGLRGGEELPTWNPLNPSEQIVVNCVVVFVDFPDDNTDPNNKAWPATYDPGRHPWQTTVNWSAKNRPPHPDLMGDVIDISITNPIPTEKKWNITTYFRDMSYGKFNLVGHVVYQQARYPFSDTTMRPDKITYSTTDSLKSRTRRSVIKHVIADIQSRIDSGEISNVFEGMDGWNRQAYRNHIPGNDETINLVVVCFRNDRLNHPHWSGWTGIANLDLAVGIPVDDGTPNGAYVRRRNGVTVQNTKAYPEQPMWTIWHEIGHLLRFAGGFESDHQYWDGMWSVMTHGAEGFFTMNSWERWRMGWLEFFDYDPLASMNGDGDTVTIRDLATHPQAIRVRLPDSTTEEYFFIEHHRQSQSNFITNLPDTTRPWHNPDDVMTYDLVDESSRVPGLYMIYKDDRGSRSAPESNVTDQGDLRVLAADGRWHWITDGWVTAPWSTTQQLRLFKRGSAARSPLGLGNNPDSSVYIDWNTYKTDRQVLNWDHWIPHPVLDSVQLYDYIWSWRTNAGNGDGVMDIANPGRPRRKGDGGDGWTLEWNDMFSPWSNPNTNTRNDGVTNIAIQLVGQTDTTSTVKIWLSNALDAPPSKPQHLLASLWSDVNWEPDLVVTAHPMLTWETNLEPDVDSLGSYIISRCDEYCDQESNWMRLDTVAGNVATWTDTLTITSHDFSHWYRICALDTQGLRSVWSEWYYIHGEGDAEREEDPEHPSTKAVAGDQAGDHRTMSVRLAVHPNPVTTEAELVWSIPEAGALSIRMFDEGGRQVAWPINRFAEAGQGSFSIDVTGFSSGVYYCLLQYRGRAWREKIILVR